MEKASGERGEHMSYHPKFEDIEHGSAESSKLKAQGAGLVKVNKRKATLNL